MLPNQVSLSINVFKNSAQIIIARNPKVNTDGAETLVKVSKNIPRNIISTGRKK